MAAVTRKKITTVYRGDPDRSPQVCVTVVPHPDVRKSRQLGMFLKEVNHSPTGFGWGYSGSGAGQLAYAILRDYLGDKEKARSVYQAFKAEVVARLEQNMPWVLSGEQIESSSAVRSILVREVMES